MKHYQINPDKYHIIVTYYRYVNQYFKKVETSLYLILTNSYSGTKFAEPLLQLVKKRYGCDVGKLNSFAETMFRLAEKGQQVIITYHKLAGSKTSGVASLEKWLKTIYALRAKLYLVKNECFRNIAHYATKDVGSKKYQKTYSDHSLAMSALSKNLESKYSWLRWVSEVIFFYFIHFKKLTLDKRPTLFILLFSSHNSLCWSIYP